MSVIIRGMKMPKTCYDCCCVVAVGTDKLRCRLTGAAFNSWSVGWGAQDNHGENGQHPYIRHKDCPLVELPPHGRLIDGDVAEVITYTDEDGTFADGILYAADWIASQPTIIEAEVSE